MQRKRRYDYRDCSEALELGHAFEIVKSASTMRKLTMKRLFKLVVLVIFGYIVISVYLKYRIANSKADDLKQEKELGKRDDKMQDRLQEVVNNLKQELKEDEMRDVFHADVKERNLDEQIQDRLKDEKVQNVRVEIVDKVLDIDDEKADFIKIDKDSNKNERVDTGEKLQFDRSDKNLEVEIEERLAEALKDAVNKVEEERNELDKDIGNREKNQEEAEKLEEKLEQEEFQDAAKNIQKKLNPLTVDEMRNELARRRAKHDDDHEFPPFVTAARQANFNEILHLIYSIQLLMPGETMHVYNLDLDSEQKRQLMSICNVKVQLFMKELFPKYVSNLDNLHWKPLVIQTALAEFGHLFWINPGSKLSSNEFSQLIHDSHETGVLLISQPAGYSTFAVTHPSMYKFIQIDKQGMEKLRQDPHLEIKAMILHNSAEVHENVMKLFTACAMEESCLAPPGAKLQCRFDFTGRKYANCHRYDESALNILVKNMFKFNTEKFSVSKASMFRRIENAHLTPKLKYCRDLKDIGDHEL